MELSRFLPLARTARQQTYRHHANLQNFSRACIHCSAVQYATPIHHPNVPGPPPQPPRVSADQAEDVSSRKQKQAELLQRGRQLKVNPSKPTSALKKRFWKEVSVKQAEDGLQITLDTRPVRTASKQILTLPSDKQGLASAIAMEWDMLVSAQQALKQHYIPLTSLTSRAVDIKNADAQGETKIRDEIVKMMMRCLSTDTLLCWAPEVNRHDTGMDRTRHTDAETDGRPAQSLRQKQIALAEPIIAHLKTHIFPGVEIEPVLDEDSIMPRSQPEMTQQVIKGWLDGLPAFELAALERGVLATKSLLVAIRLLVEWSREFQHIKPESPASKFGIAQAAEASTIEVKWQTDMWGEVEDTHDVEKEDLARQLGSVVLLVS